MKEKKGQGKKKRKRRKKERNIAKRSRNWKITEQWEFGLEVFTFDTLILFDFR